MTFLMSSISPPPPKRKAKSSPDIDSISSQPPSKRKEISVVTPLQSSKQQPSVTLQNIKVEHPGDTPKKRKSQETSPSSQKTKEAKQQVIPTFAQKPSNGLATSTQDLKYTAKTDLPIIVTTPHGSIKNLLPPEQPMQLQQTTPLSKLSSSVTTPTPTKYGRVRLSSAGKSTSITKKLLSRLPEEVGDDSDEQIQAVLNAASEKEVRI